MTDLVVQAFILIFLATYPVPIVPILAGDRSLTFEITGDAAQRQRPVH